MIGLILNFSLEQEANVAVFLDLRPKNMAR
jgi:hypothetical protein